MVLEEEEETTLLAEAATKWKQEAIFSKPDSSKPNPRVPSKSPSSMDSPYNTTGNDDLSGVIKQLQKHIDNTSNHQTTTALTSRFADVNNMENPRPSNYEHLRNILPENFPLEGIVRDRITSFAQVTNAIAIGLYSPHLSSVTNIRWSIFSFHNQPVVGYRMLLLSPYHLSSTLIMYCGTMNPYRRWKNLYKQ